VAQGCLHILFGADNTSRKLSEQQHDMPCQLALKGMCGPFSRRPIHFWFAQSALLGRNGAARK
jgi:hypothetical protein